MSVCLSAESAFVTLCVGVGVSSMCGWCNVCAYLCPHISSSGNVGL